MSWQNILKQDDITNYIGKLEDLKELVKYQKEEYIKTIRYFSIITLKNKNEIQEMDDSLYKALDAEIAGISESHGKISNHFDTIEEMIEEYLERVKLNSKGK
tara:strand:- start:543 stop:848 length:306 start_codon:yes stop_codon:yes gene_type:complete